LGFFIPLYGGIVIPPALDHAPAFSGTMKIPCPLMFCFLQKHGAVTDNILFPYQAGIGSSKATQVLSS
jgi:hypothetical protein